MNTEDLQRRLSHRGGQKLVAASLALAGLLLAMPAAQATPITSDLTITGSVSYDTAYAASNLSGTGAQSGALQVTQGGLASSNNYSDNSSSVTGTSSLSGTLTALGDGFGFTGNASANGANSGDAYGIGIDVALNLKNTSATDTYKVTFNIAFDNTVNAAGTNAYAQSALQVLDPVTQSPIPLFSSFLVSDTVNGNKNTQGSVAGAGGTLTESGPATLSFTLTPGELLSFLPSFQDMSWTLVGGAFSPGDTSSANLDAFFSIASVEDLTSPGTNPNPNPAPEPATLALLGVGLAGLGTLRSRAAR